MAQPIIAVLLSLLGPGVGQLYNREYKKGAFLIALSFIIMVAFAAWLRQIALPYLPTDLTTMADPAALQAAFTSAINDMVGTHKFMFYVYQLLLFGLWGYSVVDAYRMGVRRKKALDAAKTPLP